MNTYQLIHGVQSLDESISYLGRDLGQQKSKVRNLESEIEDLKEQLYQHRASEIARIVDRLEYIERSIDAPFLQ